MYIPRFGDDYVKPVAEGTDKATVLDTIGIGHYNGTAMPGDLGNFAVAAHRTTYGKPFNKIAELKKGDPLVVRTEDTWYVYKVTEYKIVYPQNVEVIAPVPGVTKDQPMPDPKKRFITLTSCHIRSVASAFSATSRNASTENVRGRTLEIASRTSFILSRATKSPHNRICGTTTTGMN